jgi:hypothetical protein
VRLGLRSVGAIAAAVAVLLVTPASAYASQGTVDIVGASLDVSNGELSITAEATSDITALSVEFISQVSNDDVLTVTSLTAPSDPTDGTWTATVTSAELPASAYNISVAATDQGGDSVTAADIGSVDWYGTAVPTLTASTNTISYGHSQVTLSGKVAYYPPGSQIATPDPGVKLSLATDYGDVVATLGPTAANGTYSQSVALTPGMYSVELIDLTSTFAGGTGPITESATPDPVRMTAAETPYRSDYGARIIISGTLQYKTGSRWLPLAGQQVQVALPDGGGHATTGSNGNYRFVTKAIQGGQWTAYSYPDGAESGLLTFPSTMNSGFLKVGELVKFHWFHARSHGRQRVAVTGCISAANYGLAQGEPGVRVSIQYRTRDRGAWHTLERIALQPGLIDNACDVSNEDIVFSGTIRARARSAYYRAYYPGEWLPGTYSGFAPGTSRAVRVTL